MRLRNSLAILLLLCFSIYTSTRLLAQPVYSPGIRSEQEMQWMKDSLHLKPEQVKKITPISLSYQQNMDKAAQPDNKNSRDKTQHRLMQKKDADLKALLTKTQYRQYYRREERIREIAKKVYPPGRGPM